MDFYAVNVDLSDDLASITSFGIQQGYPWPVAQPDKDMLANLRITSQSVKIAFGRDGVIVYRDGYGKGDSGEWREVFQQLVQTS